MRACTHTLYLNAFKIWLEQNEFPPYKNTSEIDLCLFHFNKSMLMPKHQQSPKFLLTLLEPGLL